MANNNHFQLTLDTLAPSGSISAQRYYKANGSVSITKGDATQMSVWFDSKAIGDRGDATAFIAANDSITTDFIDDGNYYYHLVLRDDVGNESEVYNTKIITFDKTAPVVNSVSIKDGASYTTSSSVPVKITFEDALSGVVTVQLAGDITAQPAHSLTAEEIKAGAVTLNVELTALAAEGEEEGATRTVTATVTDAAGNVSDSKEDSIELDTVAPTGALYLKTSDGSANLPGFVNSTEFMAQIDIDNIHSDVIGYKIWGDVEGATEEPASYTPVSVGTDPIEVILNFTTGDGKKTVRAKIIDEAGNETTLTSWDKTARAQTAATVAITSNRAYISKVEGFTTATISTTVTGGSSATKSWRLLAGETAIKSGTGAVPATIEVTTSDAPLNAEGAHELKLEVTDVATNVVVSDSITVTSDFTGPVASTITVNPWYKAHAGFVASAADDGAGMKFMQAWISTNANDTNAQGTEIEYADTTAADTSKFDWTHVAQGNNYVHIKYTDVVGNVTYAHSTAFGFDNIAPEAGSISAVKYTNTRSITVTIGYKDATSGVSKMKVWGDIESAATESDAAWVNVASSHSVTLTNGDGQKTINVKFIDVAGNESVAPYASTSVELDQTAPNATLALYIADGSAAQPSYTPIAKFAAHISGGDDALIGTAVEYLLYGDFTYGSQAAQGLTEDDAQWTKLSYAEGQQYMLIDNMFATSSDGTKHIYLKVKDNAGNISQAASQAFVYDTTAPTVTVSDVDYNRISKMHTARTDNASKFNDETHFVFTPDSVIQAYKVCAYANEAAATSGSYKDNSIGKEFGSVNMSATGLDSADPVNAMIKGADLEAASAGDGVKIVVVYVQDLAGTWSVAAEFSV